MHEKYRQNFEGAFEAIQGIGELGREGQRSHVRGACGRIGEDESAELVKALRGIEVDAGYRTSNCHFAEKVARRAILECVVCGKIGDNLCKDVRVEDRGRHQWPTKLEKKRHELAAQLRLIYNVDLLPRIEGPK